MEVMRDRAGNGIIICSIENFDPMGVHTGDSITVAPAQTLSDVEYQRMRVASLAILEKIGVETGGSNVQFAVNPDNGRMVIIEMNPAFRVPLRSLRRRRAFPSRRRLRALPSATPWTRSQTTSPRRRLRASSLRSIIAS